MMPRHRGLGEECTSFFRKGARSNPAANSKLAIAIRSKRELNLETKQAHALERPHRRVGGRSKWTRSEKKNYIRLNLFNVIFIFTVAKLKKHKTQKGLGKAGELPR